MSPKVWKTTAVGASSTMAAESAALWEVKAAYVKAQPQSRGHGCHWPGCPRQVPPAMWGCKQHWFTLPLALRNRIWLTYRAGQEVDGTPSLQYIEAAQAVQAWIAVHQATAPRGTSDQPRLVP